MVFKNVLKYDFIFLESVSLLKMLFNTFESSKRPLILSLFVISFTIISKLKYHSSFFSRISSNFCRKKKEYSCFDWFFVPASCVRNIDGLYIVKGHETASLHGMLVSKFKLPTWIYLKSIRHLMSRLLNLFVLNKLEI